MAKFDGIDIIEDELYEDSQEGDAEWLAAKGLLDPKLTAGWQEKNFDDKLYYQLFQSKLKIPYL